MRGKSIIWLSLIATLLSVMLPLTPAETTTTVYIDPSLIENTDFSMQFFEVDINIMDVTDLYAYGFTVKFAPYATVLVVSAVTEGPFLAQGGSTYFKYVVNTFKGEVLIGCTLLGATSGVSGSGTLVTVKFNVAEAGETAIELVDKTLLDSNLAPIPHEQVHSYYLGPTVSISRIHSRERQVVPTKALQEKVGDGDGTTTVFQLGHPPIIDGTEEIYVASLLQTRDTDYTIDSYTGQLTFMSAPALGAEIRANYDYIWTELPLACHIKNEGKVPLSVQAIFECIRVEDGKKVSIGAGQWASTATPRPTEYLYVNSFDNTREQWTAVGDAPYLDAPNDGNYIEGTYYGAQHRWFGFEDLTLGPLDTIYRVWLEGYTNGPATDDVDYDIYSGSFAWLGSLYGTPEGGWVGTRWVDGAPASDMDPALLTEAGLNNFQVLAYFYDPGGVGGPGDILDAMRLRVEFTTKKPVEVPVEQIGANVGHEFDPAIWALNSLDRGTWICSVTVYYTANGFAWNSVTSEETFSWFTKQ